MNFLAHLHLAHLAESSLPGNLLADFVSGNPSSRYPVEIVAGIYLHRRLDVLTDNLPQVCEASRWFRPETRRVAPITLDIMWDHFLSRHWTRVSPDLPLAQFLEHSQLHIIPALPMTPQPFVKLNDALWSERWMERYGEMTFIIRVLEGMARRRPRLAALAHSWQDLDSHYEALEQIFWDFYPCLMTQAQQQML